MQDIAEQLLAWHSSGRAFAVATVVGVSGSAPRDPGAALAVDSLGEAIGSVSGGCVEGAVYSLCEEAMVSGRPVLEHFGYSDEDAFAVGLTCGGLLDVFVHPIVPGADPGLDAGITYIASGTPVALARVIDGPPGLLGATVAVTADTHHGSLSPAPSTVAALERGLVAEARAMLDAGRTGRLVLGLDGRPCDDEDQGTVTVFVESYVPAPRMIVFGAIDFAAAVVKIGKFLGYHVTVCDARPVFATARRFPEADQVVVDWPHRYLDTQLDRIDGRTVLCVLTHDAKFDIPLLERALRLPVGYVGAMGSRRTHRDREARLREVGLTDPELARLHSPIGLDLGARTPEETAVSIAAEIIASRRGGGCLPLAANDGPIHHDLDRPAEEPEAETPHAA
ncbi:XdhC/CoxI family protein [Kitasatospora sp. NPDC002227]|uniref:XdhC family protein n=1 Tax=Kitasatospora sp. NPDC002227 TaxID=3154773 RepID=UPI00332B1476